MTSTPRHPMTLKPVRHTMPGTGAVTVQPSLEFAAADGAPLLLDLYRPPRAGDAPRPVVVIVPGYADEGFQRLLGCRQKDMASTVSWARLIAASGMAAVACANRAPAADLGALLAHLASHAVPLGIDPARIGLWACSGHVPVALSALRRVAAVPVACAALCYGYTMDLDGATHVADAAKTFRFDNACAGKSLDDLAADIPVFLARAGKDEMPGLNAALDRFVAAALARNLPIALVNHPAGPHAFDLDDDSETTREVIRRILAFLRAHLQA